MLDEPRQHLDQRPLRVVSIPALDRVPIVVLPDHEHDVTLGVGDQGRGVHHPDLIIEHDSASDPGLHPTQPDRATSVLLHQLGALDIDRHPPTSTLTVHHPALTDRAGELGLAITRLAGHDQALVAVAVTVTSRVPAPAKLSAGDSGAVHWWVPLLAAFHPVAYP